MAGNRARVYRERLIDEVRRHPVLYDTKHENHRDIDVRDRCWLEISERLGANSEVLKREWKILRDSLRQSLKASTRSGARCKQWRYQSRMAFILPHMTKRTRLPFQNDIKLDELTEPPQEVEEPERWEGTVATAGEATDYDSLELFFASVCQSAKRLPRPLQGQLKRQVLDALISLEEQVESDRHDTKTALFNNM